MNHQPRKPKTHNRWTPHHEAAVRQLADAAQRAETDDTLDNRKNLRSAVEVARHAGVGWTKIGDILGIASGNAYQRYRRRNPTSSDPGQRCDAGGAER